MKTLGRLKLGVIAAFIVLGMSSCLKHDDSLSIYLQYPYILQDNNGGFVPQMRVQAAEPLASASVVVAGKTFSFSKINDYVLELTDGMYNPLSQLDSVPAGYCTLSATGVNGKTADLTFGLNASVRKIGYIDATITYNEAKSEIDVVLADSVENASAYYLMIKVPTGSSNNPYAMWVPYTDPLTLTGDNNLSVTVSGINNTKFNSGTYRFALGAGYGSTLRVSHDYVTVTIDE